jgi:hypothetical protein
MTTLSVDDIQTLLEGLGVRDPIPSFPDANIESRALDIYHSYLADIVQDLAQCEQRVAYEAIQWSPDVSNGDLVVVVPRLRLQDSNPAEMAMHLKKKVCLHHTLANCLLHGHLTMSVPPKSPILAAHRGRHQSAGVHLRQDTLEDPDSLYQGPR